MQILAEEKGGKCLSKTYVNALSKILWECAEGHQWEATPDGIKQGHWCPICSIKKVANSQRANIKEMQILAEEKGGKCLSDRYVNARCKLRWECSEGHQWEAVPFSIKRGSWCPTCSKKESGDKRKLGIEEMHQLAAKRGGKCLSKTYETNRRKLLWECADGHQWEAVPSSIKRGSWCPFCAGRIKLTLLEMKQLAEKRGGKCLSEGYVNARSELRWECAKGHQWEATPDNIKSGHWCHVCGGSQRLTIEQMHRVAEERGGKCLSERYVNKMSNLLWECADGHRWEATANNVTRGRWCPLCSSGLGERICREYFEQIFEKKFPRSHPKWLHNEKGNRMELDGFCREYKIAFEHHGEQHYSLKTHYISDEKELTQRKQDDKLRRKLCEEKGIVLIEVPEIPSRLPIQEIKDFLKKVLTSKDVALPDNFESKIIDIRNAYATSGAKKALKELRIIAEKMGGRCLSETYVNSTTKLLWECAKGHHWQTISEVIKRGGWCPVCAGRQRLTIEEMHQLAAKRGGKCLSKTYETNRRKLLWECAEGHRWETTPSLVKRGAWCPACAGLQKLTLDDMKKLAEEKGGRCLSESYENVESKLRWECAEGHQWEAIPSNIKSGHWCPVCAGIQRLTIEQMRRVAEGRGGECLSDTYVNSTTKLLWKCAEGHRWEATPDGLRQGTWCPVCAGSQRLTIEQMRRVAEERGGRCLSDKYKNRGTKLRWECENGHRWEAIPDSIKRGSWCPTCSKKESGDKRKLGIEEMHQLAAKRGGKCLSKTYETNTRKLLWECADGHQWEAVPSSIKRGSWCPICADEKKRVRSVSRKLGIAAMYEIAKQRGGRCISDTYKDSKTKVVWECAEGHRWEAIPSKIKRGRWCPKCSKRKNRGQT
jgi:hypothetical protein